MATPVTRPVMNFMRSVLLLQIVLELPAAARVAELAQRLCLDLPDPLAGDVELLAHLLERPGAPVLEAEPELEDAPLATGERVEHRLHLLLQQLVRGRLGRGERAAILDEVAEVRVLLLADRRLEGHGLLADLDDLADLLRGDDDLLALGHRLGDLLDGGLAAELLEELARHPDQPVDRLHHVDRDADRAGLVRDRPRDRLPDPPRGVRRELEALLEVELLDRADEADVPLLDEVEERHPAADVLLRDRHDQAQIRGRELVAGVTTATHHLPPPLTHLGRRRHLRVEPHALEQVWVVAGLDPSLEPRE